MEPLSAAVMPPRAVRGPLLLADIGGYTSFLQSVTLAHQDDAFADGKVPDAYALVSSLLDGIVTTVVPPFSLSKLEGDAVFAYAIEPSEVPRGAAFLACIEACYAEFQARLAQAGVVWSCQCDACARIATLDLKFIVHAGPFVVQAIAGREELVGSDVVLAHRLLKTRAAALVGHRSFALITEAAVVELGIPTGSAQLLVETVDHYQPIRTHVFSVRGAGSRD